MDPPANQNLKEQFETGVLKIGLRQTLAAKHEESGHGVFGAYLPPLYRPCNPNGSGRQEPSYGTPFAHSAAWGIAAPDCHIAAAQDCSEQLRQQLRRMLKIGVHHSQD